MNRTTRNGSANRKNYKFSPILERLEDRMVPATHIWQGPASGGFWNNAANWSNGVPTSNEAGGTIVQFDGGIESTMNIAGLEVDQIHFTAGGNTIRGSTFLAVDGSVVGVNIQNAGNNTLDSSLPINLIGLNAGICSSAGGVLDMDSSISGSQGITVLPANAGMIQLAGNNTYTGVTNVKAGVLRTLSNTALGTSGAETVIDADSTLLIGSNTSAEPITINGGVVKVDSSVVSAPILIGNITLGAGTSEFNVPGGELLTLSGVISGSNNLRINGGGSLIMSGASSNTYTGFTFVNDGALLLSKTGGAIALAGNAGGFVGNGGNAPGSSELRATVSNNIADTYPLTVNHDGLFVQEAGVTNTFDFLDVLSGGRVIGNGLTLGANGLLLQGGAGANNTLTIQSLTAAFSGNFDGQIISVLSPTKVVYDGNDGNDTLIGPTTSETFNIGTVTGSISGTNFSFDPATVENYVGGSADDTFNVTPRSDHAININGGGGTNTLVIDLAGTTNPFHTPLTATSGHTIYGNRQDVDYQNIQNFSGINGTFGTNPVPIMFPSGNQDADEGTLSAFDLGDFTDTDNDGNYTVTVNWGDGTPNTVFNQASPGFITPKSHVFTQDGNFTVTVTVTDTDGTSAPGTFTAFVANVLPVATPAGNQIAAFGINQSFNLGSFTDPGDDAPWNIVVNWGDGSPNTQFQVNTPGAIPTQNHTFASPGNFPVTVKISDDDGQAASTFQVAVANVTPVVAPPGNQSANEGTSTSFNLGSFADANNSGNYTVTVNWGDGTADTVFTQAAPGAITPQNHTYAQDGNFTVIITVADVDGESLSVNFKANVGNVLPGVTPPANQGASSGVNQSFTLGSFADPGDDNPWNILVNWGDGTPSTQFQVNTPGAIPPQNHTYTDPGNFTVTVTVDDDDGSSNSSFQVSVANAVPVVTPPGIQFTNEGTSKQFLLGAFDDANNSGNYTVTVNWGDGTPNTVFQQNTISAITFQNHTYAQDGSFTVTVTVADMDGTSASVSFTAKVANVTPVVTLAGNQNASNNFAKLFSLGSFVDPGADAPWTVTVNWGDGSPDTVFNVNSPDVISPQTHTFATTGSFTVQVRINDDDVGSVPSSLQVNVTPPEVHVLGNVFRDFNRDGSFNTTDKGQQGIVVFADRDGDGVLDSNEASATTDLNGNYNLSVGFEGAVNVRQVVPAGFTQTTNNPGTVNVNFGDTVSVERMGLGRIVKPVIAVGGRTGNQPFVQVRDVDGTLRFTFTPYPTVKTALKEVRLATGDTNDDGIEDIIAVPGPGIAGAISIFSGVDGSLLRIFAGIPFPYTKGLSVAAGDVNGDGASDIFIGSGVGVAPQVKVFDGVTTNLLRSFSPTNASSSTGVKVAAGDVNGDGVVDIITAPGVGNAKTNARIIAHNALTGAVLKNFLVKPIAGRYDAQLAIAAGDLDGDGRAEILLTTTRCGQSQLQSFKNGTPFSSSTANVKGANFQVAAKNLNGDGVADLLFAGAAGQSPRLKVINSATGQTILNALILSNNQRNGLVVG